MLKTASHPLMMSDGRRRHRDLLLLLREVVMLEEDDAEFALTEATARARLAHLEAHAQRILARRRLEER